MDNLDLLKQKHLITKDKQYEFTMAGNAKFTVENMKTGNRFSFRVKKSNKKEQPNLYFVSVDTNLENRRNILTQKLNDNFEKYKHSFQYNYLGVIFSDSKKYFWSKKSRIKQDSQYNEVFKWIFNRIKTSSMPDFVEFYHNNYCARCGKTLKVPESIISGFGPECEKIMGHK